jgi:hypothetical protein
LIKEEDLERIAQFDFDKEQSIKDFLSTYGYQYQRIDEVKLLGKGGENMIFRVNSFMPVEIIAKVPLT